MITKMKFSMPKLLFTLAVFLSTSTMFSAAEYKVTVDQGDIVTFDCTGGNWECCSNSAHWEEIRNRGNVDDQSLERGRYCSKVGKFQDCRGLRRQPCKVKCDNNCKAEVELDVADNKNNRNKERVTDGQCLQKCKRNCPCTDGNQRNRNCARQIANKQCGDLSNNDQRRVVNRFEDACDRLFDFNV